MSRPRSISALTHLPLRGEPPRGDTSVSEGVLSERKVGTVGAPLESNPTAALNVRLLGVESATQLAQVMASVGLAQNFAALRALATDGIQKGHMTLHARSVVTAAGVPEALFDDVLDRLVLSNEIKVWKAREIAAELKQDPGRHHLHVARTGADADAMGVGYGKVVLLGEHAVVYGRHAIGAPVPEASTAQAAPQSTKKNIQV